MTEQAVPDFPSNNPWRMQIPENLVIRGDLNLRGRMDITQLPDNLTIVGDMDITGCLNLDTLPANLFVGGCLRMSNTGIKALPADLHVEGDIWANGLDLDIPDGFTAKADLYLSNLDGQETPLRLPDNLTVNGALAIIDRKIKKWPKNLTVKGRIALGHWDSHNSKLSRTIFISGVIITGLD